MQIKTVDQEFGSLQVQGELRRGYRFRLMVRDSRGFRDDLREQMLSYKKRDLAATMMNSSLLPPAFGAIVASDVERSASTLLIEAGGNGGGNSSSSIRDSLGMGFGTALGNSGSGGSGGGGSLPLDSGLIGGYLPVPTAGFFGGGTYQAFRGYGVL